MKKHLTTFAVVLLAGLLSPVFIAGENGDPPPSNTEMSVLATFFAAHPEQPLAVRGWNVDFSLVGMTLESADMNAGTFHAVGTYVAVASKQGVRFEYVLNADALFALKQVKYAVLPPVAIPPKK